MFVSPFLLIVILVFILTECLFLGKYVSVTQEIFTGRIYILLALGSVLYLFSSALVLIPFYFFKINIIYISAFIIIKDGFIGTFLIARRSAFSNWRVDIQSLSVMALFVIIMTIVIRFAFNNKLHSIGVNSSLVLNNYKLVIEQITLTPNESINFNYYFATPFILMIAFSIIMSLSSLFSRKNNLVNGLVSSIITAYYFLLFHEKINLINSLNSAMMIFLIYIGYHLIVYSRRRYGIIFGFTTIVGWSLNTEDYFMSLSIFLAIITIYSFSRRPRILFFTLQMGSPFLIILALELKNISIIGSIISFAVVTITYILIFYLGKYHFIDRLNWFVRLNYVWPILLVVGIFTWGVVEMIDHKSALDLLWLREKSIMYSFNNSIVSTIFNVMYYISLISIIGYLAYGYIVKRKSTKENTILSIMLVIYAFAFNPFVQAIYYDRHAIRIFRQAREVIYVPLLVSTSFIIINNLKLEKIKRNLTAISF